LLKMKTPRIPISPSNQLAAVKKVPAILPSSGAKPLASDLLPPTDKPNGDSGSQPQKQPSNASADASVGIKPSQYSKPPFNINGSAKDELFSVLFETYKAAQEGKTDKASKAQATVMSKPRSAQSILKPFEMERLKELLLLVDGGRDGNSSGGYTYNARTDTVEPIDKSASVLPPVPPTRKPAVPVSPVPKEYADVAALVEKLPEDFDLSGWDDKSAAQQQRLLQNSGLTGQEQMQLLNSKTSLETLAVIQDIQQNRSIYGLSNAKVNEISEKLLKIASDRIGIKNHDISFARNNVMKNVFLEMLDEEEHNLIGSFMNLDGDVEVPKSTGTPKKDNRIPLEKGKYIGYNTVDLTEDLYTFMRDGANKLKALKETAFQRKANFTQEFIDQVESYAPLDIKRQDAWKFREGVIYLFNGEKMRNDDIGNIAFGYYGAAVYGKGFLHFGAGLYQLISDVKGKDPIQWGGKFFDNPQDYDMIEYGYRLYMEDHPE
jgi:hypothetical protein